VFPLTTDFWFPSRRGERGDVVEFMSWCKECKRTYERERHQRKMREDPEYAQRFRERLRANAERRKAVDPDADRRRRREYEARLRANPSRLRARRELSRISYYLRSERQGRGRGKKRFDAVAQEADQRRLPLEPFAVLLEEVVGKYGSVERAAPSIGAHPRTLRAWVKREREYVQLDAAERILRSLEVRVEDVWPDALRDLDRPMLLVEARAEKDAALPGRSAATLASLLKLDGDPRAALAEWFEVDWVVRRRPGVRGDGPVTMGLIREFAQLRSLSGRIVLVGQRLAKVYDVPFWGLWTPKPGLARMVAIPAPGDRRTYADQHVRRAVARVLKEATVSL
jgi:hypothetical protein